MAKKAAAMPAADESPPDPQLIEAKTQEAIRALNEHSKIAAQIAKAKETLDTSMAKILAPFAAEIESLNAKYNTWVAGKAKALAAAEAAAKDAVREVKATVHGDVEMCTYASGAVRYNIEMLEGLRLAMPELAAARSVGEPVVSLRKITAKK